MALEFVLHGNVEHFFRARVVGKGVDEPLTIQLLEFSVIVVSFSGFTGPGPGVFPERQYRRIACLSGAFGWFTLPWEVIGHTFKGFDSFRPLSQFYMGFTQQEQHLRRAGVGREGIREGLVIHRRLTIMLIRFRTFCLARQYIVAIGKLRDQLFQLLPDIKRCLVIRLLQVGTVNAVVPNKRRLAIRYVSGKAGLCQGVDDTHVVPGRPWAQWPRIDVALEYINGVCVLFPLQQKVAVAVIHEDFVGFLAGLTEDGLQGVRTVQVRQ